MRLPRAAQERGIGPEWLSPDTREFSWKSACATMAKARARWARTPPTVHYNMSILSHLERVAERRHLTAEEAEAAMYAILNGEVSAAQIAGLLVALRMKGE